jgi:hypothetical protein
LLGVLALLAPFVPLAALGLAAIVAAYAAVLLGAAFTLHARESAVNIALAIGCMHFGYGLGFGRGVLDFIMRRRAPRASMTRLTR